MHTITNRTISLGLAASLLLAVLVAPLGAARSADTTTNRQADDGGNCNNYGFQFAFSVTGDSNAGNECTWQECAHGPQGAGSAGVGVGNGASEGEGSAEATAGTECKQTTGGNQSQDTGNPGNLTARLA